jgi:ubiquinone/menaquinone biosynthesis C-methylase UbiE
MEMTHPPYTLGHSDRELDRLSAQDRLVAPSTRHFFREAGLRTGMRVLDVGSGAGDTAFLAAEMVGETGEVIGTDRAAAAVVAATTRAKAIGFRNVSFREGDPSEMTFERPFDAVVARYVLLFQADPVAMVRKLLGHLRPGGLIVFHEPDWSDARSLPPAPTYDRCCRWIIDVFRLARAETKAESLYRAFVGAGLPQPSMQMHTLITGPACAEWLQAVTELVRTLVPKMEELGVATAAEVDVETLAERMLQEVTARKSVIIGRSEIGAWSRVQS